MTFKATFLILITLGTYALADSNQELLFGTASGNVQSVARALANGADPNYADQYGITALAVAANNGFLSIASMLVEKGAQVNKTSDAKCPSTSLWFAAYTGQDQLVSYLASQGGDAQKAGGCFAESPLQIAQRYNRTSTVTLLRKLGAH